VAPLVWRFPGADEYIPQALLWDDLTDATRIFDDPYMGRAARGWVETNHDARKLGPQYQAAIDAAIARAGR
jgi:hypothetical protein